jgi:hypothetical protein
MDKRDRRSVAILAIPVHQEDIVFLVDNPELETPTNIDLVNVEWELDSEVMTHGSATAAYACYQSHARMRQESFMTFPQWLVVVSSICRTRVQLGLNLTIPQTTA